MSFDELLETRIGQSSTYRCQVGLHEYDSIMLNDHRCRYCGTKGHPAIEHYQPKLSWTASGSTVIENLEELASWHQIAPHKFTARLFKNLGVDGHYSRPHLTLYDNLTAEQIMAAI